MGRILNCCIIVSLVMTVLVLISCVRDYVEPVAPVLSYNDGDVIKNAVTDIDGNSYDAVYIGNQVWMAENLRTTRYADGSTIPLGAYGSPSPCRYAPGSGQSNEENADNVDCFGYLYNWSAVMHGDASSSDIPSGVQGVCPSGWHVPSAAEWGRLIDYVSGKSQYQCDSNSVNIAKSLSSTTDWDGSSNNCAVGNDLNSNNATGFSALPAGGFFVGTPIEWDYTGYKEFGKSAFFWSATMYNGNYPIWYGITWSNANVSMSSYQKNAGFSVRCIRD